MAKPKIVERYGFINDSYYVTVLATEETFTQLKWVDKADPGSRKNIFPAQGDNSIIQISTKTNKYGAKKTERQQNISTQMSRGETAILTLAKGEIKTYGKKKINYHKKLRLVFPHSTKVLWISAVLSDVLKDAAKGGLLLPYKGVITWKRSGKGSGRFVVPSTFAGEAGTILAQSIDDHLKAWETTNDPTLGRTQFEPLEGGAGI